MSPHRAAVPAMLPSRRPQVRAALAAVDSGAAVIITGSAGSGRATFGQTLLAARRRAGHPVHRVTGSATLAGVPFACLAALTAQLRPAPASGHPADVDRSPADVIADLARAAAGPRRTLFLDRADEVDAASAAAIVQLHGAVDLIVGAGRLADLPADLQRLAFGHGTHQVHLAGLDFTDARALLEDLFDEPFNASAINRLVNLSGGSPLHLRELAVDADRAGALPVTHGYRTLRPDWTAGGRRLADLIAGRIAALPGAVRVAVERVAMMGPIPRQLCARIVDRGVLDDALAAAALVVTTRNARTDIAQNFDGPGARARFDHPEELVQLGAGLTSELVLTTVGDAAFMAHVDRIRDAVELAQLPAGTRLHLAEQLRRRGEPVPWPSEDDRTGDDLGTVAEEIVDLLHRGEPDAGIALFARVVDSPAWHAADAAGRTVLVQAMFLAMIGEGSRPDRFDEHFTAIDWQDVSLDHAVFLTGRGDLFLEMGDAAQAADLFAQALALMALDDAHHLAGFAAGLDAVAATMTGDRDRARAGHRAFTEAPAGSGGLARPDVERAMLLVVRARDGVAAARQRCDALVAEAQARGHAYLVLRLLHDAWRLRLVEAPQLEAHLIRLAEVAATVNGTFARTVEQYATAFGGAGDPAAVASIVAQHLSTGRVLFAAEAAARGAELAQRAGDRSAAGRLLGLFGDAVAALADVDTPSLGRARIDPDVLSEREAEVSARAAAGLTNPQIAAELFLSPRTVEGHLQRAYAKLGITDRRQLLPARAGVAVRAPSA